MSEIGLNFPNEIESIFQQLFEIVTKDVSNARRTDQFLLEMHLDVMKRCSLLWTIFDVPPNQSLLKEKFKINVVVPNTESWISLYKIFEKLVELEDILAEMYQHLNITPLVRTEELMYLKMFLKCTQPTSKAIEIFERKMIFGAVLPTLLNLRKQLKTLYDELFLTRNKFAAIVNAQIQGLNKRLSQILNFENFEKMAAVASYFHPQFKAEWIKRLKPHMQAHVQNYIMETTLKELPEIMEVAPPVVNQNSSIDDLLTFSPDFEIATEVPEFNRNHVEISNYLKDERKSLEKLHEYPNIRDCIFLKYIVLCTCSDANFFFKFYC